MPDRADNCDLDPSAGSCNNRNMRTMHFVGIGGGVSITLFAALARAVLTMPRTVNGTGHTGPSEFCATSI